MDRPLNRGRFGHWPDALPEWPRSYRRYVYDVQHAVAHPNYVGMFRDYAYPAWWRDSIATWRNEVARKRFLDKTAQFLIRVAIVLFGSIFVYSVL